MQNVHILGGSEMDSDPFRACPSPSAVPALRPASPMLLLHLATSSMNPNSHRLKLLWHLGTDPHEDAARIGWCVGSAASSGIQDLFNSPGLSSSAGQQLMDMERSRNPSRGRGAKTRRMREPLLPTSVFIFLIYWSIVDSLLKSKDSVLHI